MSIGTNIKKLRRERDITQEQLAEILRLTPSAISQWETDRVLPDITYLPKLANVFRVSADVILGIDIETKEVQIEEIYNEARELFCTGNRDNAIRLYRQGLEKYPDAYKLMVELAFCLSQSGERTDMDESIALFERIRAGTNDEDTKNFAIGNLCGLYMNVGKPEMAKSLADTIPDPIYTRAYCRRMTLRGEEWVDEMRSQIYGHFDELIWDLRNLMNVFCDEHPTFTCSELLTLWQKVIGFVELFYEDHDYAFDEQLLINAHFRCAKLYVKLNNPECAFEELEKMLIHITSYDRYSDGLFGDYITLPPDKWHTSLLVRPRDKNDPSLSMTVTAWSTENAAMEYLNTLSDNVFDSIRDHYRFKKVEERLRETAR